MKEKEKTEEESELEAGCAQPLPQNPYTNFCRDEKSEAVK